MNMKIKNVVTGLMVASMPVAGSVTAFATSEGSVDALGNKTMASIQVEDGERVSDAAAMYSEGLSAEERAAETVIGSSDGDVQPAGGDQAAETVIGASNGDLKPAGDDKTAGTTVEGDVQPAENAKPVE